MPRKFPPLTPAEVRAILEARGFQYRRTRGSHELWEHQDVGGKRRAVTVDSAVRELGVDLIKSVIDQSGLSREEFYCSTRRTAAKINMKVAKEL